MGAAPPDGAQTCEDGGGFWGSETKEDLDEMAHTALKPFPQCAHGAVHRAQEANSGNSRGFLRVLGSFMGATLLAFDNRSAKYVEQL